MIQTYGGEGLPQSRRSGPRPDASLAEQPDRQPRDRDLRGGRGRGHADDTNYSLGSVLNHVLPAPDRDRAGGASSRWRAGEYPDVVIGCVGGGSNFAGLAFPFMLARSCARAGRPASSPPSPPPAPRSPEGTYAYDFGDTVGLTPLVKMYTLGHDFVPPPFHAGGLRYHGDAPLLCQLVKEGVIEARAYRQNDAFEAAVQFAQSEGIIPAPESAHAIRAVIDEARGRQGGGRRARRSSSTSAATATSTWAPTTPTTRASSRTSSSRRPTWPPRCSACPRRPPSPERCTRAWGSDSRWSSRSRPGSWRAATMKPASPAGGWVDRADLERLVPTPADAPAGTEVNKQMLGYGALGDEKAGRRATGRAERGGARGLVPDPVRSKRRLGRRTVRRVDGFPLLR